MNMPGSFSSINILDALTEPKLWWEYHCKRPLLSDVSQYRSKVVLFDALSGTLTLTGLPVLFLSHPVVWRLSAVRQLGLVYYEWPSATHTRLAHSLDVAQMARKIMEKLNADNETQETAAVLGLIHDLGQSAFSHAVDGYAGYLLHVYWSIAEKLGKRDFEHLVRLFDEEGGGKLDDVVSVAFIHECDSLKKLMSSNKYLKPEAVQYIFMKEWSEVKDRLENDKLFVAAQFIFGNKKLVLDLDRLSYLVRDSYFIGDENIRQRAPELEKDLKYLKELYDDLIKGENMYVGKSSGVIKIGRKSDLLFEINYQGDTAVRDSEKLVEVARRVREKLYEEIYEGREKAMIDAIVSFLFYRYLKIINEQLNNIKQNNKNNSKQLDELKSALLGMLLMNDDVLIYNICRIISINNDKNIEPLCEIATRLREFLTLIDAHNNIQHIPNSNIYLILIKFDKELAEKIINILKEEIKEHNLQEPQVISTMHHYFKLRASRLNIFTMELEALGFRALSGQLANCRAIFMPLHYVFKDLASETDINKNITLSGVEQTIMNYAKRSQLLVEVLLYCDSQLQNYSSDLKEYLGTLRTSIADIMGEGMLRG
jgi:HD superfamily phosphohydrolase